MITKQQVGDLIARLRKKHGLSQSDLAERIGVRTNFVSMIECGLRFPSFATLNKISKVLGCSFVVVEMQEFKPKKVRT